MDDPTWTSLTLSHPLSVASDAAPMTTTHTHSVSSLMHANHSVFISHLTMTTNVISYSAHSISIESTAELRWL